MIRHENPDNVLRIARDFPAPPAFVFALWSEPELLRTWWGPEGCRLHTCEIDFRVGGRWRFNMIGETSHWTHGTYHEIVPAERLVFSYDFDDLGVHSVVSVRFAPAGADGTRMAFCQTGFPDANEREGHNGGWNSTFHILGEALLRLHGMGSVWPDLPEKKKDGVARDLEAARQGLDQERTEKT